MGAYFSLGRVSVRGEEKAFAEAPRRGVALHSGFGVESLGFGVWERGEREARERREREGDRRGSTRP